MSKINAYYEVSTCTSGQFSTNDSFYFLSNRSGMNQVWKAFPNQQPTQITNTPDRVWSYHVGPNGKDLFLSMDKGGNENEQIIYIKDGCDKPIDLTCDASSRNQFGGVTPDGKTVIYASNARSKANFDICAVNIDTKEKKILLENTDNYNWPCCLSPNGRYLLYNKLKGLSDNHLWMFDIETGIAKDTGTPGKYAQYQHPSFLHDNSGFFVCTDEDAEFMYVAKYDIASGTLSKFYETNWDVETVSVSKDDRYLAMLINEDGYDTLKVYDLKQNRFLNIPQPPKGVSSYWTINWSTEGHKFLFTLTSGKLPAGIWLLDIDNLSLSCVERMPLENLDEDDLVDPQLHHFTSFDGLTVPYWYFPSTHASQGVRAVCVDIHGGPEGQERPMYGALTQYLLSQGISIVAPNIRGSVGYGKTYTHLDDVEKRLDSVKDIEYLVRHLVEQGFADADRIAVMGASYGGFMTLSCVTRLPKLWACGVDEVGMTNLVTFLENTSEYRRSHRESEYGSLEKHRDVLYQVSPIAKVNDIVAPLMIVHGANDPRVPVSEAEMIVENVQSRGIEVKYLRYDDEGHGLAKRKNQLDCYPQVAAFLKKHLGIE